MKLILGSAQFSSAYGINNKHGKVSFNEINKILKLANQKSVRYIDIAIEYKSWQCNLMSIFNKN